MDDIAKLQPEERYMKALREHWHIAVLNRKPRAMGSSTRVVEELPPEPPRLAALYSDWFSGHSIFEMLVDDEEEKRNRLRTQYVRAALGFPDVLTPPGLT